MEEYNTKLSNFNLVTVEGEILHGRPTEYADQKACKRGKWHMGFMQTSSSVVLSIKKEVIGNWF